LSYQRSAASLATMGILRSRSRWMLAVLLLSVLLFVPALFLAPGRGNRTIGAIALAAAAPSETTTGMQLYEERCATCHGEQGQGTANGPPISGLGPAWYDFMLSTGRMPVDRPVVQASRKRPAFTRPQIDALITYLVTLPPGGGVPIPQVAPALGDLSQGQSVFELNCAPCHGTTGNGGAVGPQVAPSLHQATPTQIAEAVRIGPGAMPPFDERTLTQQQLNSLARYVLYLRTPLNAGGAGLGHYGPIIEGFVGLLVGLGALVLVVRYIGSRT
jgi:ubiquinol-cytochrome c reductase cytochrome c subunit